MEHVSFLEAERLRHPTEDHISGVRNWIVDDTAAFCDETERSDYSNFHVPYGPSWDAARIQEYIDNANFLLNSEGMQDVLEVIHGEEWRLHRHPAFVGNAQECIEGTCNVNRYISSSEK